MYFMNLRPGQLGQLVKHEIETCKGLSYNLMTDHDLYRHGYSLAGNHWSNNGGASYFHKGNIRIPIEKDPVTGFWLGTCVISASKRTAQYQGRRIELKLQKKVKEATQDRPFDTKFLARVASITHTTIEDLNRNYVSTNTNVERLHNNVVQTNRSEPEGASPTNILPVEGLDDHSLQLFKDQSPVTRHASSRATRTCSTFS